MDPVRESPLVRPERQQQRRPDVPAPGHVENGRPTISDPAADTRITARPKPHPKGFPSLIPA